MTAAQPGREGRPWRRLAAQVYAEETLCWLCGRWVDQALPAQHRMSRTVDHVIELRRGGPPLDRTNLRLAHRTCNTVRSNRLRAKRPRQQVSVDIRTL